MLDKLLVFTDSRQHKRQHSFYRLMRALDTHHAVGNVFIADRAKCDYTPIFNAAAVAKNSLITVQRADRNYDYCNAAHYRAIKLRLCDADAGLLQIFPPLDNAFLSGIARIFEAKPVINAPSGLMQLKSKAFLTQLTDLGMPPQFLAPMAVCRDADSVERFRRAHGDDLALKALESYGGADVARYTGKGRSGPATLHDVRDVNNYLKARGPCLVMPFMRATWPNDKRIEMINGHILSVRRRFVVKRDEWRCNLSKRAWNMPAGLDAREHALVKALKPIMRAHGAHLWNVEVLRDADNMPIVSEINAVNPQIASSFERFMRRDPIQDAAKGIVRHAHSKTGTVQNSPGPSA